MTNCKTTLYLRTHNTPEFKYNKLKSTDLLTKWAALGHRDFELFLSYIAKAKGAERRNIIEAANKAKKRKLVDPEERIEAATGTEELSKTAEKASEGDSQIVPITTLEVPPSAEKPEQLAEADSTTKDASSGATPALKASKKKSKSNTERTAGRYERMKKEKRRAKKIIAALEQSEEPPIQKE